MCFFFTYWEVENNVLCHMPTRILTYSNGIRKYKNKINTVNNCTRKILFCFFLKKRLGLWELVSIWSKPPIRGNEWMRFRVRRCSLNSLVQQGASIRHQSIISARLFHLQHQSSSEQHFGWKKKIFCKCYQRFHGTLLTAITLVSCWKSSVSLSNYISAVTYYIYAEPAQSLLIIKRTKYLYFKHQYSTSYETVDGSCILSHLCVRFGSYSYVDTV